MTQDPTVPGFAPTHLLVHYDEIALKGGNRPRFEEILRGNVYQALRDTGASEGSRLYGRLLFRLEQGARLDELRARVRRVFGVSNYSLALELPLDLDLLAAALGALLPGLPPRSFAIHCHRANKRFPLNSAEVNRRLGAHVQTLTGWRVQLDDPELPIHVFILDKKAFLSFDRSPGPGGLPTGVAGRVVCLLSGGIDSPTAAHRVMKRGAQPVFVHFHSAPHTSAASQEKVRELVRIIVPHGDSARLYLVPFGALQQRIVTDCPPPFRVLLYRRFMLRAAEAVAKIEGALALVTGESLGQVASQTLENLHAIDCVSSLPVLRPLVGSNKIEIIDDARRIGTYETSIEPHEDCCSFLMPSNPATYSTPRELEAAERVFDVAAEVARLVATSTVEQLGPGGR